MRNNARGANAGVSKTMPVPIFLPVDLMRRIDSTVGLDVESPGAGPVARNTAVSIMILQQVRNCQQQKTITMDLAVRKKKDLRKRPIVLEDTQDIVSPAGLRYQDDPRDLGFAEVLVQHVV